ncbi:MAG TPA: ParA family partition ATPase [Magnetospirillaceae bacterium]|jgi:chromosome partitioning protein
MAAKIVAVAQRKGGAGKTTLVAQLGVAWSRQGLRVAMLDVDPQGSLTAWASVRQSSGRGPAPLIAAVQGWKLGVEIDRLRNAYDLLVIDTPPHAETDARVAIRAADLMLVPLQPSPMDLWATGATLELAKQEKRRPLLVLNRLPARSNMIAFSHDRIAQEGLPLASVALGNRTAYVSSMAEGAGVAETEPSSPAAQEIESLTAEIARILVI